MQQLRFYCTERLQFGTGDKASDAQRNRLGHSRINACGDGASSSVDEARGSSLLEGEYVTSKSVASFMQFEYSKHWIRKKKYRSDITDDALEYCIQNSNRLQDRHWEDAWNAIARIPPSGRLLKVVYKTKGKTIKILTAYWLD